MSLPPQNGDDADRDWMWAKTVSIAREMGSTLSRSSMPDVHVDAVDEHLPAPPLRAVDERRVPLLVGDLLLAQCANGCVAPPISSMRSGLGGGADLVERALQVRRRLGDGAALARPDLDGVEQQLLRDQGVLGAVRRAHGRQDRLGRLSQVAGVGVDQRDLPLDADGGPLRPRERQGHRCGHQAGSTTSTCWLPATRVRTIVPALLPRRSSWRRSCSGTTAVPRFLMVSRPTSRSRR